MTAAVKTSCREMRGSQAGGTDFAKALLDLETAESHTYFLTNKAIKGIILKIKNIQRCGGKLMRVSDGGVGLNT
jgi:hypothetical protein